MKKLLQFLEGSHQFQICALLIITINAIAVKLTITLFYSGIRKEWLVFIVLFAIYSATYQSFCYSEATIRLRVYIIFNSNFKLKKFWQQKY